MSQSIGIQVRARTESEQSAIVSELRAILAPLSHVSVGETTRSPSSILVLDSQLPGLEGILSELESSGGRKGLSIWLRVSEGAPLPALFSEGRVDDLLIHPIRPLELIGKLKHHEQLRIAEQVMGLQSALSGVMKNLQVDLDLLDRLQKARLPVRFPDVKGFKITSRYLAGQKSGGDYFDLAESADNQQLAILVTDSSSYGLSSAVLSAVVRVVSKVSAEQSRSVREMVRGFYDELLMPLGPNDRLSIFYGTLSRKDYILKYLTLGSVRSFYRGPGRSFEEMPAQGGPLSQGSRNSLSSSALKEGQLAWEPGGRMVILSDGFLEALGGIPQALELLEKFKGREGVDLLNELAFGIKSRLEDPKTDLPPQDATGMVMDLDPKVIRRIS